VQAFFLGKSWPDLAEGAVAHTSILIETWLWIGLGCVLAILGLVNEASRSAIAILLFQRALRWRTHDACMHAGLRKAVHQVRGVGEEAWRS